MAEHPLTREDETRRNAELLEGALNDVGLFQRAGTVWPDVRDHTVSLRLTSWQATELARILRRSWRHERAERDTAGPPRVLITSREVGRPLDIDLDE